MPTPITMPALSPTMTHGTLSSWLKSEGDAVEAGDVIAEIETDKATMEVEAVDEGILAKVVIKAGSENVPVGSVIAVLAEDGEDISGYEIPQDGGADDAKPQLKDVADKNTNDDTSTTGAQQKQGEGERIIASPLAKRIAADMGINLAEIKGSGANGRIVKADLDDAQMTHNDAQMTHAGENPTSVPHSGMRKVIAQRLTQSKQTIPHFYLSADCTLDALLAARASMNEGKNYKISVNDFIIKACAAALMAVPDAHVAWGDDAMTHFHSADISVAVSTPSGLITPIVKGAQDKGLAAISSEVKSLAARARDGALTPREYQGGTFTLSNLGMYGVRDFAAIINPPQSMILAVGAGGQRAVVEGGALAIRSVMSVTLSVDHRAVDGAVAAQWLAAFKGFVENPVEMLA